MASVGDQVLDNFAAALDAAGLDRDLIDRLRSELAADKLPKPEHLVDLFAAGSGQARA